MSQIVLDDKLKFLITGLTLEHRGELFTSILEKNLTSTNKEIVGVYQYIMSLQKDIEQKKQHMREIGSKGGKAKKQKHSNATPTPSETVLISSPAQALPSTAKTKRKETKENNIYNNKIKNFINDILSSSPDVEKDTFSPASTFIPPTPEEVKSFIKKENLSLSAETFTDFYQARNWYMGKTKISDWQAVARMWHRRQQESTTQQKNGSNKINSSDEQYWQELQLRVKNSLQESDLQDNTNLPPFKRFIKRVEDETNLLKEKENDSQN